MSLKTGKTMKGNAENLHQACGLLITGIPRGCYSKVHCLEYHFHRIDLVANVDKINCP